MHSTTELKPLLPVMSVTSVLVNYPVVMMLHIKN